MALVRNFTATASNPGSINLTWDQPLDFNNTNDHILVHRSISHFLMELENTAYPTTVSDNRGIEILNWKTEAPVEPADSSSAGELNDSSNNMPINMGGRLLRDSSSNVFKISESSVSSIKLVENETPAIGPYVVLADFPSSIRESTDFENDIRTTAGNFYIKDLVSVINGTIQLIKFETDELANLIFKDGNDNRYIVKSNTEDTVYFYDNSSTPDIPVIGAGMSILNSFNNVDTIISFVDNFKIESEATTNPPSGSGLRDNVFYYYTAFTYDLNLNVAQVESGTYKSEDSTQVSALNIADKDFGNTIYNYWPTFYRRLDATGDLYDLMKVFGFQFNELHALVETYRLQNTHTVFVSALTPLSEQTGLPSVGYSLGIDTLRRIANDLLSAWKLKGTKEGIALFIKIITTWDITDGTADFDEAINDDVKNIDALRWYSPTLGSTNTRLVQPDPFIEGGRFATTLPGIVIPGFFTFKEFVINIPNVALHVGESESIVLSGGNTILTDSTATFGAVDSLVGNFLLPNQAEINDVFEIIANTATTITVRGIVKNRTAGGNYVVLSPLNTNRFIVLNNLLSLYIPFKTKAGFIFI